MQTNRFRLGRVLFAAVMCMTLNSVAKAGLLTIGTATYQSNDYSLIYEADQGLVWLDYTNSGQTWTDQMDWAAGLGTELTLYIDPLKFEVTWQEDDWRLPSAGDDPEAGYDQTTSEMGHLYYVTLGNASGANGFTNSGDFQNLETESHYWTNTGGGPYGNKWQFGFERGYQGAVGGFNGRYGLAVREANVTPEPATLGLLALGGLAIKRGKRKQCRKG